MTNIKKLMATNIYGASKPKKNREKETIDTILIEYIYNNKQERVK